jgi:hypothetical protein
MISTASIYHVSDRNQPAPTTSASTSLTNRFTQALLLTTRQHPISSKPVSAPSLEDLLSPQELLQHRQRSALRENNKRRRLEKEALETEKWKKLEAQRWSRYFDDLQDRVVQQKTEIRAEELRQEEKQRLRYQRRRQQMAEVEEGKRAE